MKGTRKCQVTGFLEKNITGREEVQDSLEFTKNTIHIQQGVLFQEAFQRHNKEPDVGEVFKLSGLLMFDLFSGRVPKWALIDNKSEVRPGFGFVLE